MNTIPIGPAEAAWLARAVKNTALFANLELSAVERLLGRFVLLDVPAGTAIIKEGAADTALFILYAGKLGVQRSSLLVFSKEVGSLKPGDFFGEMALIVNGAKRTATVRAGEACRVFRLDGAEFSDLLKRNKAFRDHMTRLAMERKARST